MRRRLQNIKTATFWDTPWLTADVMATEAEGEVAFHAGKPARVPVRYRRNRSWILPDAWKRGWERARVHKLLDEMGGYY